MEKYLRMLDTLLAIIDVSDSFYPILGFPICKVGKVIELTL